MQTAPNRPVKLYNKQIIDRSCQHGLVIEASTIQQEWDYETKELFPWVRITYMNGNEEAWKRIHCGNISFLN